MGDRSGKEERKRVKRFLGDERAERADEQVRSLEASSVAMDDARELRVGLWNGERGLVPTSDTEANRERKTVKVGVGLGKYVQPALHKSKRCNAGNRAVGSMFCSV